MRSRGPIVLALVALGALVAVIVNAFVSSGSEAAAPIAPTTTAPAVTAAAAATEPVEIEQTAPPQLTFEARAREFPFDPKLTAKSFVAVDADQGVVLIAHHESDPRPIASLTKVMTALVVIERGELDRKIKVPKRATRVEPNREGLLAGHWYTRRLLLQSALMVSANDSAQTLAINAGGGSLERFYLAMNARAADLGMEHTRYASASGLDDEANESTALDQAILARAALDNPVLAKIVRTKRKLVAWPPPTYAKEWVNHNRMLRTYEGTYGLKTGYTKAAGACLIAAVERDGHRVIAVVLGSKDIWKDMPRLLDEAFARLGVAPPEPA